MLEYFITLVVMTENNDAVTQRLFGLDNTPVTILVIQGCIRLEVNCGGCHDWDLSNVEAQILAFSVNSANPVPVQGPA